MRALITGPQDIAVARPAASGSSMLRPARPDYDAPTMLAMLVESAATAEGAGSWDEALACYETAFARVAMDGDAAIAAELLRRIGTVHRQRGALELAGELYEESLAVAEANELPGHIGAALNCMAAIAQFRGELKGAEELYKQARALAVEAGDEHLAAMIDLNVGTLCSARGDTDGAVGHFRLALAHAQRNGDDGTAARALTNMGMAEVERGAWRRAEECFHDALYLAEHARDALLTGTVELQRAELYLKRQRFEQAREGCDRALRVFNRVKSKSSAGEAYKFCGILYRETGKSELADTHFALALGLAEVSQNRLLEAESQLEWAQLHLDEGRVQDGVLYLNRALRVFMALHSRRSGEAPDVERRLTHLLQLYVPTVAAWADEINASKDPYQAGQPQRVADYSCRLARELGASAWELTWLRIGALVRDMGNMAVPAEVLGKAEVLKRDERELVQVHTIMGDAMVRQLHFPSEIRPMVRNHHEHWDGTGYPDRLAGEAIALSARILCVTDVYSALTSPRSYRPGFGSDEALRIMANNAGRVLDPAVFVAFREMLGGER